MSPASALSPARERLVGAARSCLGTPFGHLGRVRGISLDCAGLLLYAAADAQVECFDHPGPYARWPVSDRRAKAFRLRDFVAAQTNEIRLEDAREGSVLLFWAYRPDLPQHLAIQSGPDMMVHAWSESKSVMEIDIGRWREKLVAAFDFRGVD